MATRKLISFDWALKRLLRSKANFGIPEGFLSELLSDDIQMIKVEQFDDLARDRLDEWIYFLENEEIRDELSARGLREAKDKLDILKLPEAERRAYDRRQDDLHYQASMMRSTYGLGRLEGRAEGRDEGLAEGLVQGREARTVEIARGMLARGIDPAVVAEVTGLAAEEIGALTKA